MVTYINKNVPYFLEVRVTDTKGSGVENLLVEFEIIKISNNAVAASGLMESKGKGVYCADIILAEVGQYRVLYDLEDYYVDSIETIVVEESVLDKVNSILGQLASISEALGTTSSSSQILGAENYTFIMKRDVDTFRAQYNKLLSNGWLLIKVEGNVYHFRKGNA